MAAAAVVDHLVFVDLDRSPEAWRQVADVLYSHQPRSAAQLQDILGRYPGCSAVAAPCDGTDRADAVYDFQVILRRSTTWKCVRGCPLAGSAAPPADS